MPTAVQPHDVPLIVPPIVVEQNGSAMNLAASSRSNLAHVSAPVTTPTLLSLGADLKSLLEQPEHANIGDFAAAVERLQGELLMMANDIDLLADRSDDYAELFADAQTRDFSTSDIGQIETVLNGLRSSQLVS
jgi:hypothetical protein